MAKFFGKYRGVVTNNRDPMQMGRIRAQVPGLFGGNESGWAMPCVPGGLSKVKGSALPKIGARVWIEFEKGDPDSPIWTGFWFGNAAETPAALKKKKS